MLLLPLSYSRNEGELVPAGLWRYAPPVAGKLIEFPRRLEWVELPMWVGVVKGTLLLAKVERAVDGEAYQWSAWNAGALLGQGLRATVEEAMDEAKLVLERSMVVVRPLVPPGSS